MSADGDHEPAAACPKTLPSGAALNTLLLELEDRLRLRVEHELRSEFAALRQTLLQAPCPDPATRCPHPLRPGPTLIQAPCPSPEISLLCHAEPSQQVARSKTAIGIRGSALLDTIAAEEGTLAKFKQAYGIHIGVIVLPIFAHCCNVVSALCPVLQSPADRIRVATNIPMCCFAIIFYMSSVWACRSAALIALRRDLHEAEHSTATLAGDSRLWELGKGLLWGSGAGLVLAAGAQCFVSLTQDSGRFILEVGQLPSWGRALYACNSICTWLNGLIFTVLLLLPPWAASRAAISEVIRRLDCDCAHDWDGLTAEVLDLDGMLEKLWSVREAGAPWLLALLTYSSNLVWNTTMAFHGDASAITEWAVSCVLDVIQIVGVLFAMSTITASCQDTGAMAASIPAAALRALCHTWEAWSPECRSAHARFVSLVRCHRMGVEIGGVLVTPYLVLQLFVTLGTALPTLYGILQQTVVEDTSGIPA